MTHPEGALPLGHAFSVMIGPFFSNRGRAVGGHAAPDKVRIADWSLEPLIAKKAKTTIDGRRHHTHSDVMIGSRFSMVCVNDAAAPAYFHYACHRIADTAMALVEAVVAGRLAL